jgi:hypothetical protein
MRGSTYLRTAREGLAEESSLARGRLFLLRVLWPLIVPSTGGEINQSSPAVAALPLLRDKRS